MNPLYFEKVHGSEYENKFNFRFCGEHFDLNDFETSWIPKIHDIYLGTQRLATFRDWTLSGIGNPPIL